jgi:hypothetical protein
VLIKFDPASKPAAGCGLRLCSLQPAFGMGTKIPRLQALAHEKPRAPSEYFLQRSL